jgi:hypothetical protein
MGINREEMLLKEYEKSLDMRNKYEEMILNPKDGVDMKFITTSITYYRAAVERLSSSLFRDKETGLKP